MTLDCLNGTRVDDATVRSIEMTRSSVGWFISSCVLSASLVGNSWLLTVSWGAKNINGIFKYPVCYLAFCDVLLVVVRLAQSTFHLFADASTYLRWCAVPYALAIGAANAMICALIPTPLQRCLVFVDQSRLSDHAQRPRSLVMFCAALLILSMAPPLISILASPDRCLTSGLCPQLPVNGLFTAVTPLTFLMSYIATIIFVSLFVFKVKQMKTITDNLMKAANATTTSELNINRDILAMAVVQTVNPLLLTAPTITLGIGQLLGVQSSGGLRAIAVGVFLVNPLVDALSTIYFIKPYRRLALSTAKRIGQFLHISNNVVNPMPMVILNVKPAA